ncbi:MAG: hypothetical protein IJR52_09705, partial [Selenomonadaceae bacterium]|nr:hypothetical protein [Selenomonadaceae bacterium]
MIDPLPNSFSICFIAAANASFLSMVALLFHLSLGANYIRESGDCKFSAGGSGGEKFPCKNFPRQL